MAFGHRASRKQTYALVGITGHSGTGKTYSALRLAFGMAQGGTVAMIDTENGRGEMYSSKFPPYQVESLYPPFTPPRYTELVAKAEAEGAKVLIIDSFSHEWEAQGGVLEMAENYPEGKSKFKVPKLQHKKLINAILQSRMHVIISMRGKDEMVDGVDEKGKKTWKASGRIIPIQERRLKHEMTVSLIIGYSGNEQDYRCKLAKNCPEELHPMFADQVLTEQIGKDFATWLAEGEVESRENRWKRETLEAASLGTANSRDHWKKLPKEAQDFLKRDEKHMAELATSREQADDAMQIEPDESPGQPAESEAEQSQERPEGAPDFSPQFKACHTIEQLNDLCSDLRDSEAPSEFWAGLETKRRKELSK